MVAKGLLDSGLEGLGFQNREPYFGINSVSIRVRPVADILPPSVSSTTVPSACVWDCAA